MRRRWELDDDLIAGPDPPTPQNDAHHARPADQIAVFVEARGRA